KWLSFANLQLTSSLNAIRLTVLIGYSYQICLGAQTGVLGGRLVDHIRRAADTGGF
ncbi:hypothetical protein H9L39_06112, partial [Fusarium oxysporum f. sp. albedinis]